MGGPLKLAVVAKDLIIETKASMITQQALVRLTSAGISSRNKIEP